MFFWTFTGNLGRLYLGWEDIQTALPKLPLSMVKASETLHPGRGEGRWERRALGEGVLGNPSPGICDAGRDLLGDHLWGCWGRGRAGAAHLPRFSWVMTEGGGLTLSVPPGQKLLVIQVTFSSTTCTWEGGRAGPQSADSNAPRFPQLFSRAVHCSSDPPRGHGGLLPSRRAQRTCHWPPPTSFSLGSPSSLPAPPSPYLFDHHTELALGAEHRLDA